MIYFIFLASLALVTCYLAYHWRNRTVFWLRKQLVHLSTRLLTMLLCLLFTLSTSNLLTCPLVDLSTYHVILSFIYPIYKQLVDSSTRWLVHLPCYSVFYLPCLQATCSLVHSLTCLLTMLLCLLFTLSTSNLLTCPLVDLSTYHVTLSFIYPVYKQLVYSSTRWLVHLPCYQLKYRNHRIKIKIEM